MNTTIHHHPNRTITITPSAYEGMLCHAQHSFPLEACGVLAGQILPTPEGSLRIEAVYPITNTAVHARTTFSFAPDEWTRTYYDMQKNRQSLVGFFHSHPSTAPLLSSSDLDGLQWVSVPSYWILSLASDQTTPQVRVYRQVEGRWRESMFAQVCV